MKQNPKINNVHDFNKKNLSPAKFASSAASTQKCPSSFKVQAWPISFRASGFNRPTADAARTATLQRTDAPAWPIKCTLSWTVTVSPVATKRAAYTKWAESVQPRAAHDIGPRKSSSPSPHPLRGFQKQNGIKLLSF